MKKTFSLVILSLIFCAVLMPVLASAQLQPNDCCKARKEFYIKQGKIGNDDCATANSGKGCKIEKGDIVGPDKGTFHCDLDKNGNQDTLDVKTNMWGVICLLSTIFLITDWVFYLLGLAVVLMVIYGGFLYVTAAGDPTKAAKGKTVLTFAIIGLVIASLAKIIPSVVQYLVGV